MRTNTKFNHDKIRLTEYQKRQSKKGNDIYFLKLACTNTFESDSYLYFPNDDQPDFDSVKNLVGKDVYVEFNTSGQSPVIQHVELAK